MSFLYFCFSMFCRSMFCHRPSKGYPFENIFETYLQESCQEMDTNPLDYWKIKYINYPTLAKLANKLLSTPATSAPVERLFSMAGKVFRPQSCSLKDDTFEKLNMMIKCNHQSESE